MKKKLLNLLVLSGLAMSCCYAQGIDSVQTIINDMTLAPDAALHGVPSNYSWANGAASPQPMPVPAQNNKGQWWQAMTDWGQAYIPVAGSTATNTRLQIRNVISKLLMKNGTWVTVQSGSFGGAAYVEDFSNNANIGAGERDESSNGGGLSVIVGVGNWAGHNYHFYATNGRANVDINNVVGVFTCCEARLIIDDVTKPDDRNNCKNILQMGADWWLNTTTGWLPDWSANSGIGSSRSKWVTKNWQFFNFCTLTPAQIIANPPIGGTTTSTFTRGQETSMQLILKPNPANQGSIISYQLITNSEVKISVYDLLGKEIMEVANEKQSTGEHQLNINTAQLQSGIYFVKMNVDAEQQIQKLIISQ